MGIRKTYFMILTFLMLLLMVVLALWIRGSDSHDKYMQGLRLPDRAWVEEKLKRSKMQMTENEMREPFKLSVGPDYQQAYRLDDGSELYVYTFPSEEERVQGQKTIMRQSAILSSQPPASYEINNVLLLYFEAVSGGTNSDYVKKLADGLLEQH
ncbi:hypothetical protein [Paenibacillus soyae]|uniref:Uncharacterized protein n=1 Tax=Paenibacillus soyae TaxID=2969249 RepID=A0A9X2S7Y0_9BACL|nr:hypothetical protein [Paenibacillus soyae]MCR2803630.1 hypothetical protein [Paenibacillus soyae]